jgi:hypothetical protein
LYSVDGLADGDRSLAEEPKTRFTPVKTSGVAGSAFKARVRACRGNGGTTKSKWNYADDI